MSPETLEHLQQGLRLDAGLNELSGALRRIADATGSIEPLESVWRSATASEAIIIIREG